ncbi:hypothetical protein BAE44_0025200 [Dichanthelium oligosanthes]|uniref:Uncharacterized protein n=1 Tax=Dichanthelium oligosanthes TaxID=888268 RepID=A0A1E5ULP1_9POAL|nr:hypothetical protein BAE44_0025200 [Dichanthelium oligosanthes]
MLRVSYRGIILTWGSVPRFCIDGRWLRQGASSSVATVVAKAEGSVVREEIRNLIWADQRAFGKAELDVDGEIPDADFAKVIQKADWEVEIIEPLMTELNFIGNI